MSKAKKITLGLIFSLIVITGFWFFDAKRYEKHAKEFLSENGMYVSASNVSVSGYPFFKKVTATDIKINLDHPFASRFTTLSGQFQNILISEVVVKSLAFMSTSTISVGEVSLQDYDNVKHPVEFSSDPKISISLSPGGKATKFFYSDSGYKAFNADKNIVREASSTTINYTKTEDETSIKTSLKSEIKGMSGFDPVDTYSSSYEKRVITKIRDGEITISSYHPQEAQSETHASTTTPAATSISPAQTQEASQMAQAQPAEQAPLLPPLTTPVDVSVDIENSYPSSGFNFALPVPGSPESKPSGSGPIETTKIKNISYTTSSYKISISGEIETFQDDKLPSMSLLVKASGMPQLTGQISAKLSDIIQKETVNSHASVLAEPTAENSMFNSAIATDSYKDLLKKVSTSLSSVAAEIGSKNAQTTESEVIFEIKRGKNLEFTINSVPAQEVMGKL